MIESLTHISKREARDAARLALQSAVAAAAMFTLMQATDMAEKFVGVLSAVLVVQPSIGNTLVKAWERFAATLIGIVIGGACLWIMPDGYGSAAALALSMLVLNAVAAFRPAWRYGVVAAVALALGSDADIAATALDRSLAIGVGVVVGVIVSFVIWPDSAEKRSDRFLRSALRACADCLDRAINAAARDEQSDLSAVRSRYISAINSAREAASNIRFADRERPVERVRAVERFYHAILILERVVDENIEITGGQQELVEPIRTIRDCSCVIARKAADGEYQHDERLGRIDEALEALRERVVSADDDPRTHEYRNALLFGLDEIEDSVHEMLRTLPEQDRD